MESCSSPMDRSEVEPDSCSAGCSVPHRPGRENLSSSDTNSNEDENCLFQDAVSHPLRDRRIRRSKKQTFNPSSASNLSSDDSSALPLKMRISKYLKNLWSTRKQKKKRKIRSRRKRTTSPRGKQTTRKHQQYSPSLKERRRRLLDRGIQFPFTPLKYLPFSLYFPYEQFVLGGFLHHVENLKYEHSLKQSLENMELEENLNYENFGMREYRYLDEDEPLSPISVENLNEDEAEEEVKVVENSDFILDCDLPSEESWQLKKKNRRVNKS